MKGNSPLLLILFLVISLLLSEERILVHGGGPSPSECTEERRLGVNACKPIVFGQPASPACCKRVRVSHFECVCPVVTAKLAALIDINRVIKLLKGCRRRVPRHFKCGSKANTSLCKPKLYR